jgi:hypothetical protein
MQRVIFVLRDVVDRMTLNDEPSNSSFLWWFLRNWRNPNDEQCASEVSWVKTSNSNGRKILPEQILSEEDVGPQ